MSVPLWLLDVDGVLNAVSRRPDRSVWKDWQAGTAWADGAEWPILWSPSVTRKVRELHEAGRVEVRWLTTWRTQANGSLRELLDLPELLVAGVTDSAAGVEVPEPETQHAAPNERFHGQRTRSRGGEWWKLTIVRQVAAAEPGRRVLWTDDDLASELPARSWAEKNLPGSLLLAPQPYLGLTPKQLRQIEEFVS